MSAAKKEKESQTQYFIYVLNCTRLSPVIFSREEQQQQARMGVSERQRQYFTGAALSLFLSAGTHYLQPTAMRQGILACV